MKILSSITTISAIFFSTVCTAQKAIICGKINNTAATEFKCSFIPSSVLEKPTAITIPLTQGSFKQAIDIKEACFLSMEDGNNYYGGVIQPGDSIVITYNAADFKNTLSFSGKGKEKFLLAESINQIKLYAGNHKEDIDKQTFPLDYFFGKMDSIQAKIAQQLRAYKTSISPQSFNLLNGLMQATLLRSKYNGAVSIFGDSYNTILKTQASRLTNKSKKDLQNLLMFDGSLPASYFYTSIVANILSVYFEENIKPTLGDGLTAKYEFVKKRVPTKLQAAVLYLWLDKDIKQNKDSAIETIVAKSFPAAKDSIYQNALLQKLTAERSLKNGIDAPDFSVENTDGETVRKSSFKNKVVYLDFWFAACTPCHKLFADIEPVKKYFRTDTNVVFLVVSIDNKDSWKKAVAKFNIPGYHVFTENKYREHPIIKAYNVSQYPTTYIIGKNGKIISTKPSDNPDELTKEIAAALAENY